MEVRLLQSQAQTSSRCVQVSEVHHWPYKEAEVRTQQIMRSKAIENLSALANKYVDFNASDVSAFISDLVNSGEWQATFGAESVSSNNVGENSFLSSLAGEYKTCKDKEVNNAIRKISNNQNQKVLIGDTLKGSRISLTGKTSELFTSLLLKM